jgi:hypothetical protein
MDDADSSEVLAAATVVPWKREKSLVAMTLASLLPIQRQDSRSRSLVASFFSREYLSREKKALKYEMLQSPSLMPVPGNGRRCSLRPTWSVASLFDGMTNTGCVTGCLDCVCEPFIKKICLLTTGHVAPVIAVTSRSFRLDGQSAFWRFT